MSARADPQSPSPSRFPRLPRTLGARLGGAFYLLAALSAVLYGLVLVDLARVGADARKFLEETREARRAESLRLALTELGLRARLPAAPDEAAEAAALARARRDLDGIFGGPPGRPDPSRREHQAAEDRIAVGLRSGLAELEAWVGSGAGPAPAGALDGLLARLDRHASALERETATEAYRATADLARRVQGVTALLVSCAVLSILAFLLVFRLVQLQVLRPIQLLRRGAERLGQGELDYRVEAAAVDEVGDLARELNRMADRLARSHRELEERVRERTRELLQAGRLAELGTFAAGIAHEVNTPLASIATSAEGLERRLRAGAVDRERELETLQTIAREAYRARDITARLLTFARRDPGPRRRLRLADRAGNVLRMIRHAAGSRGLGLEVDLDGLLEVEANGPELDQVLLNLLKNAVEASPNGGVVRLSGRPGPEGEAVLEVRDQGPGLPAGEEARVFEPFFTTKQPGEGTGLGLAIAYRIVERHGGRIEAGNAPGGGALFRVVLPAAGRQALKGGA